MREWLPPGVTLEPVLPVAAVGLGLAVAAAVVMASARAARDRPVLAAVEAAARLALLAVLAALLLNPQRLGPGDGADGGGRPEVRLVVDRSASMATADAPGGATRAAFAEEAWVAPLVGDETRPAWSRGARVEVVGFGEAPRTAGEIGEKPPRSAAGTSLLDALDAVLASSPAGADATPPTVVLLSDGRETVAPDPTGAVLHPELRSRLRVARARGLAVHTVTLGEAARPPLDLAAGLAPTTPFWVAGEPAAAELTVTATRPAPAGVSSAVRVSASVGGGRGEGRSETLFEADLRVDATLLHTLAVPVPPATLRRLGALVPGANGRLERAPGVTGVDLAAELLPIEGEATEANNRAVVRVPLSPMRLRVLVLEGQPYWDTKFLAQALRADAGVQVEQVTRVTADRWERISSGGAGGPAQRQGDASGDVQRIAFSGFNVVMLGRNLGDVLSPAQWDALTRYVEAGGNLVLTRGRPPALAAAPRLDPMAGGVGDRLGVGSAGLAAGPAGVAGTLGEATAAAVRADAPTLRWLETGPEPKPATRVVLEDRATRAPALVAMTLGRGTVVAVLGEGLWRWALPSGRGPGRPGAGTTRARYDAFWGGLARGLLFGSPEGGGGDADAPLRLDLAEAPGRVGEPVRIGVRLAEGVAAEEVALEAEAPSGVVTRLRPAAAVGEPGGAPGDGGLSAAFTPQEAGVHTIRGRVGDAEPVSRVVVVRPLGLEATLVSADASAMREIAARTGGEVLNPADPSTLLGHLRDVAVSRARPPRPEPLWPTPAVLLALVTGWAGLWTVRKAAGLP